MRKASLLLALVLILVSTGTVLAAEPAGMLTRGEFAALLVEAGGLEGELSPADLLVEKGIMQGYPDGGTYLDQGITRLEAVTLAAKTLGLEGSIVPPAGVEVPLPAGHWGYNFYAWFVRQGLVEGAPTEIISREEGEAFLKKVFGSDPAAIALQEEIRAKTLEMENMAMRMVMSGNMTVIPRAGLDETEEFPEIGMKMKLTQEMVMPDRVHQVMEMDMAIPGVGEEKITTETYIADGKMYQRLPDPETGELKWFRQPESLFPNLDEIIEQARQVEAVPAGMEKYFHYHLLGTTELDGEEVHVFSFYGRVDDFNAFFELALGQFGGTGEFQQALAPVMELIKSMSFWGIEYVGVEDLKVRASDFTAIVTYADEFMGEAMPIEAAVMSMEIEEYEYDADITIEVPAEVLEAEVLEMTLPVQEELPEEPQQ
ncbi:MAG: DUF6612 family protein [bacterium]|jgi:hypothetical protein